MRRSQLLEPLGVTLSNSPFTPDTVKRPAGAVLICRSVLSPRIPSAIDFAPLILPTLGCGLSRTVADGNEQFARYITDPAGFCD